MMLFAAGCYGNTNTDGATRSRTYGGNVTRGRAYSGAYDGLYGGGAVDGAMHGGTTRAHGGTTRAHGGTTRAHGGTTRGHANRTHGNTNRAHGHRAHDGAGVHNYHGNRPMVGGLEYLR